MEAIDRVSFVWDSHYACNYRCPYCWFDKQWEEMDEQNVYPPFDDVVAAWKRIYDLYGECHIMITGGEPMLYPNFINLIVEMQKYHTIKVTSQLSCDTYTFARKVDPKRVVMDFNFHPLDAKHEPLIRKILFLKKKGFSGGVCYLAYPPNMDKIEYYKDEFEKHGIGFALAAFWGEYNGKQYPMSYTEEEKKMMAPYMGDITRLQYHLEGTPTKGKFCRAGKMYASIKANGNVTRCGPMSHKVMGNIFDKNFKLFDKPMPCEAEKCPNDEYVWLVPEEKEKMGLKKESEGCDCGCK